MHIPFGCPHAVRNTTTSLKVAVDFMPVSSLPYALSVQAYRRGVAVEERATSLDCQSCLDLHHADKLRAVEYLLALAKKIYHDDNL